MKVWLKPDPEKPWLIYLGCGISLIILAIFSVGYYHPDEHFQILEFAHWKTGHSVPGSLPWEFYSQIRSSIQPAIAVILHNILSVSGDANPFLLAMILRFLSAGLSFVTMWMMYRTIIPGIKSAVLQKWFLVLSFLLWFSLYNFVRFSSETWSGDLFIIGFCLLFSGKSNDRTLIYFFAGLILGLSFLFRFQSAFLILGLFLWMIFVSKERRFSDIFVLAGGILLMFLSGILIDRWFYGKWTLTFWNYFFQNIVEDKISGFGIQPWYYYFQEVFIRTIPPFSLVIILSFLFFFIYLGKNVLTWILVPFLVFHFMIGHKEIRFLFPLIGFIPAVTILALDKIADHWPGIFTKKSTGYIAKFCLVTNMLLLLFVFINPADNQANLFEKVYTQYPEKQNLFYCGENPFQRALTVSFYKHDQLKIKHLTNLLQPSERTYLVAVRSKDPMKENLYNQKLIYNSYPQWIKYFNFNNWISRTNVWYLYEVDKLTLRLSDETKNNSRK